MTTISSRTYLLFCEVVVLEIQSHRYVFHGIVRDVMMHDDSISAHDAQSPIAMSEFQSNSPFPTSNFNPLVRYGYLPGLPAMSLQTSRLLWFSIEGRPTPYSIRDISISDNVDLLKAKIQQRVQILDGIDPDDLELWKVISLIPKACAF